MVELEDRQSGIRLTANQRLMMLMDVQLREPEEACGLLGGIGNMTLVVIRVTNVLRSRYRFRMDPAEQLRAFQRFERQGLDVVGIYHSHPAGPEQPSQTDINEAYYPEAAYLIWSQSKEGWKCRTFRIHDTVIREVPTWVDQL